MRFAIFLFSTVAMLVTVSNANARCVLTRNVVVYEDVWYEKPLGFKKRANQIVTACKDGRFVQKQKVENGETVGVINYRQDISNLIESQTCTDNELNPKQGEVFKYEDGKVSMKIHIQSKDSEVDVIYAIARTQNGKCESQRPGESDTSIVSCTEIEPTKNFLDRCGTPPPPKSTSLLSGYDSREPSHSMTCNTGKTGWWKYEVIGDNLVIDGEKTPILERQGDVFAIKGNSFMGEVVSIVDYRNEKVTQKSAIGEQIFRCQ